MYVFPIDCDTIGISDNEGIHKYIIKKDDVR